MPTIWITGGHAGWACCRPNAGEPVRMRADIDWRQPGAFASRGTTVARRHGNLAGFWLRSSLALLFQDSGLIAQRFHCVTRHYHYGKRPFHYKRKVIHRDIPMNLVWRPRLTANPGIGRVGVWARASFDAGAFSRHEGNPDPGAERG